LRAICFVSTALSLAGCWVGDAAFRIAGRAATEDGRPVPSCLTRVYDSDVGALLDEGHFDGRFEETVIYGGAGFGPFSFTGGPDRIHVTVACDGYKDSFRSADFAGETLSYDRPLDLGTIVFREPSGDTQAN
jgi:hypothetical protein